MKIKVKDKSVLDVSLWADVITDGMSEKDAAATERRKLAMRMFVGGKPISAIRKATGMVKSEIYRLFHRCIAEHMDGRIFGFRACRSHAHVSLYARTAPLVVLGKDTKSGYSGAMGRIAREYPDVITAVVNEAVKTNCYTESTLRSDKLHRFFLDLCRKAGVKTNQYPFGPLTQGRQALTKLVKQRLESSNLRKLVNAVYGEDVARRLGHTNEPVRVGSFRLCFERVEFDAHRIDILLIVEIPDPAGGEPVTLILDRLWILVVVEATSRAVLGYFVSLNSHYTQDDVLACIENSIVPWKPRSLTIDELAYPEGSGLPSGAVPGLEYALWAEFAYDNDKSNCANRVWEALKKKVGCVRAPGPVRSPERRQIIERFFGTLEKSGFQRLPNTTGRSPSDPKRREPEKVAMRYKVTLDELSELIDVMLATYNSTPTTALHGRSPLEYLRFALERQSFFVRQVPESERQAFSLSTLWAKRVVRGRLATGKRPYIEFEGVRYFSERLGATPSLIGTSLTVECNTKDLRTIKVYLPNGEEFGILSVTQAWAYHPHDLRMRRAVMRCIHLGRLKLIDIPDPIRAFMDYQSRKALKARRERNLLAHAMLITKTPKEGGTKLPALSKPGTDSLPLIKKSAAPFKSKGGKTFNY